MKKAFHYSTDVSQGLTDTLRVLTGILHSNSSWGNEHYAAQLKAHVLTIREGLMVMRSSIHAITDRLDELDRKLR